MSTDDKQRDTLILGAIDPGKTGAVAIWNEATGKVIVKPCPKSVNGMADLVRKHAYPSKGVEVFFLIEKVQGGIYTPKKGSCQLCGAPLDYRGKPIRSNPNTQFNFGKNAGHWEMAMAAFRIPCEEVTPQSWQKSLGNLPTGRGNRDKRKAEIHRRMIARFPKVKVTKKASDAVAILWLAMREHGVAFEQHKR